MSSFYEKGAYHGKFTFLVLGHVDIILYKYYIIVSGSHIKLQTEKKQPNQFFCGLLGSENR